VPKKKERKKKKTKKKSNIHAEGIVRNLVKKIKTDFLFIFTSSLVRLAVENHFPYFRSYLCYRTCVPCKKFI